MDLLDSTDVSAPEAVQQASPAVEAETRNPRIKRYGLELVLDMHDCNVETFTKENLHRYFVELCELISMKRHGEPMIWHDDGSREPHMKGVSAVQFIETSDIVVHAIDVLKAAYVNIFSCKDFDPEKARKYSEDFFQAKKSSAQLLNRI